MVYEKKVGIYNRSWWRRFGRPFGLTGEPVQAEGDEDNPDMKTKVDRALLHDIVPQPGGDFEPMEGKKCWSLYCCVESLFSSSVSGQFCKMIRIRCFIYSIYESNQDMTTGKLG